MVGAVAILAMLAGSCGDDDGDDSIDNPAQVVDNYRIAYNGGDIDEVMTLFSEKSEVSCHPVDSEAAGLAAIRALHNADLGSAADADAYKISNIEVSGDTVTWDHVWTNGAGEDWCAEGNNAVIANGQMLSWTLAANRQPCA